jgi:RNA polymerase sigma-70 factor (ECF subfamily)
MNHVDRLRRFMELRLDPRLRRRVDSEDLIQEIYMEAWRKLPEYRRDSTLPFYLWLRGLARNKLLEIHRQHLGAKMRDVRREKNDCSLSGTSGAALSFIIVESTTSPSGAAAKEEVRLQLESALETMDDLDREVLVLRHYEQLSPGETAQVLGIQEKAAGMRYMRAIRRLREILASLPGGLSEFRL